MGAAAVEAPHVFLLAVGSTPRAIHPHRLPLSNLAAEEEEE
jgi:hypothetical protein